MHRNNFSYIEERELRIDELDQLILVDTSDPARCSNKLQDIHPVETIIYDHHPNAPKAKGIVAMTGACVTLLLEEIYKQNLAIEPWERTLFALGLYSDTGSFMFESTTARDVKMLNQLFSDGISLQTVNQFHSQTLTETQQHILKRLLDHYESINHEGISFVYSVIELDQYVSNLSAIVERWVPLIGGDSCIAIVKMKDTIFVVARSSHDRFDVRTLMEKLGGGGHHAAAAATIKDQSLQDVKDVIDTQYKQAIKPATTVRQVMSTPVKTVTADATIDDVLQQSLRFGHSGFPVVDEDHLRGIISVRDANKAHHHGLGHAPVKGHMTENVITVSANTALEEAETLIIQHDIGRLPIIEDDRLVGILTRSDLLQSLYSRKPKEQKSDDCVQLPTFIQKDLESLGSLADDYGVHIYLVGGIVRDLLLDKANDDIDVVVEGDAVQFADFVGRTWQKEVVVHESFQTAKVKVSDDLTIDLATTRAEYYDHPSALPQIIRTHLKEDMYRRDFTINAMAISLNQDSFMKLIDLFGGRRDLEKQLLRPLHNLSFIEDPTRILRGLRFEGRFGFRLTDEAERFASDAKSAISKLSFERIGQEWAKVTQEKSYQRIAKRLDELNLLTSFFTGATYASNVASVYTCIANERLDEHPFFYVISIVRTKCLFFTIHRENKI
ncbi:CBS domain-containing protein [Geomicrobium sp. JCM 19055]|uniref:CBS domain-containing protein n=1 Tax=Geomicrobium sp. JCM 19055 TaxID=1460649 RepID=UPI00045ED66B|nr:CBS domain-containing protein [Geomicrobium sp. JCM 19055]GAK00975.1 tRNA nucleotidyltransferase [Geomicrobium sp. JCM 19055]